MDIPEIVRGNKEAQDSIREIEEGLDGYAISGGIHPEGGPFIVLTLPKGRCTEEGKAISYTFMGTEVLVFSDGFRNMVHELAVKFVGPTLSELAEKIKLTMDPGPSKMGH